MGLMGLDMGIGVYERVLTGVWLIVMDVWGCVETMGVKGVIGVG